MFQQQPRSRCVQKRLQGAWLVWSPASAWRVLGQGPWCHPPPTPHPSLGPPSVWLAETSVHISTPPEPALCESGMSFR